jgi:hypothetical protein
MPGEVTSQNSRQEQTALGTGQWSGGEKEGKDAGKEGKNDHPEHHREQPIR